MATDRLKEAMLIYVEQLGRDDDQSLKREMQSDNGETAEDARFEKLWTQYENDMHVEVQAPSGWQTGNIGEGSRNKKRRKKALGIAIAVAAALILAVGIGTAASQDWDDSMFGALRRLLDKNLDQNEFSVSPEEIVTYHIEKVGFILSGDEYSTDPTVKEFLIHGWKVDSSSGALGFYDNNGQPVTMIDSYILKRGEERLKIFISEGDLLNGLRVRDCRLASMDINVDTYINQSNVTDFTVGGVNLLDCSTLQMDELITEHVSEKSIAHYAGGTATEEQWANFDAFLYPPEGIMKDSGIIQLRVEINNLNTLNIQNIVAAFKEYGPVPDLYLD